ncbi:hypothetical protein N8H74_25940 [Pseudomonas sp. B2M1-30]|uniref:hypothetical protein n=1 Tax=Pseudomonas TaxID=286 RepID=UPI0021CAA575|nr:MULTISPECIES: hypothetical protein [Pseudomonas]MCU0121716.1 hypothetical protein [Pseudomonas sp. B2M1-30]MCU7263896.1 hypothetical protein [Pseudomonas koreensis]
MTRIACLGWGSLIWEPKGFPIQGQWFMDGPLIPVEFARQSHNGRITLVLIESESFVHSLWALMQSEDLASAIEALACREGILGKNVERHVCRWSVGQPSPRLIPHLSEWADAHDIDQVIWTGLPPKFNGKEVTPSAEQVVEYLERLTGELREIAEQYVRLAPRQIDTQYRRLIESSLHWYAESSD